jgi:hypothetical protein
MARRIMLHACPITVVLCLAAGDFTAIMGRDGRSMYVIRKPAAVRQRDRAQAGPGNVPMY